MSSENAALARSVADLVGGPDNITWVGSCTTRLRFVVKDEAKVNYPQLNETPGVMQALKAGGQTQVVIGTHVEQIRDELYTVPGWSRFANATGGSSDKADAQKRKPVDVVFDFLGGIFQPLIAPMTGAAMVIVVALLLNQFAGLPADSPTYLVLNAAGNAIFYFLPIFVAFTASQKLGVNPFVGAVIAAALLHPSFTGLGTNGDIVQAFGMPLYVYSYASSMFPALLLALAYAGFDRVLRRVIPKALQQVFVPTFEMLILVPATALVFGPIGVIVGNGIGEGTKWLSETAPFIFYVVLAAVWIFLVAMGIHWALISIGIADMANLGYSVIFGAAAGYQYAMMGIAIAMFIRVSRERKNRALRDTAAAASLAVALGGITEPTIYGLVLRYRRVLVIEIVSAAAAGFVAGLFNLAAIGYAPSPLFGLPLVQPLVGALVTIATGVVVPILLINIFGYEKKGSVSLDSEAAPPRHGVGGFQGSATHATLTGTATLNAPLSGDLVPLSESGDPVFAGGLIGPGVAIAPRGNTVVAPADGTIVSAPATAHAIGLRTDDGVEVLIHVGIDTVKLAGTHFTLGVVQGQHVRAGETLLTFDAEAITSAGYSLLTPVVVTNLAAGYGVNSRDGGSVSAGEPLLTVGATTPA